MLQVGAKQKTPGLVYRTGMNVFREENNKDACKREGTQETTTYNNLVCQRLHAERSGKEQDGQNRNARVQQ
jgi:hypothetical protein